MTRLSLEKLTINTSISGPISVYLHGSRLIDGVAVLTIHDIGCNHHEFVDFVSNKYMEHLSNRCFWLHIEIPGQGDNDLTITSDMSFPSIQKLSESISEVCDNLKLKNIVLIGDGAGANICARLAIFREDIVLGLILINCTGRTAGFIESIQEKIIGWKLNTMGMNPTAESFLLLNRFGQNVDTNETELRETVAKYRNSLRESINPKNLNRFLISFMERTNITGTIGMLNCPVQFLTGSLAFHKKAVNSLYNAYLSSTRSQPAKRGRAEMIEINAVANVMRERPDKVAECIQHFLQGLGIASGAMNRRMSGVTFIKSEGRRSLSMDEYDQPKGVKNLIYDQNRKYSIADQSIEDVDEGMDQVFEN